MKAQCKIIGVETDALGITRIKLGGDGVSLAVFANNQFMSYSLDQLFNVEINPFFGDQSEEISPVATESKEPLHLTQEQAEAA